MAEIEIYRKIQTNEPVMIAGWPGMGNVALGAISFLRRKLESTVFAEIKAGQFFTPEAVVIEDGMARLPRLPQSTFYYSARPELVIFESDAQISGQEGFHLMNLILDLARQLNVNKIFTGAAFPMPISHLEESSIYGVANQKKLLDWLGSYQVKIMERGQISGLNGLLLGYARQRGIDAACLLATMPNYAISFPNPKASKAILSVLSHILRFEVDMTELDLFSQEMDKRLEAIEGKIQEMFHTAGKLEEIDQVEEKEIPKFIMEKVEKLFQQARTDKRVAYELKEELDRWDLFKFYEDRFLDLFKEDQ